MQDINSTLNTNFAKIGFYSDLQSRSHSAIAREMIDKFAADGYGGVLFEITVGINTDGTLQNKLTYEELFTWMDYADKKGLKTGVLPNWNFNGGNAEYIGSGRKPIEFSNNNMLNSMKTFINEFLPKLQDHGLDIFYLSQNNSEFFVSEYRDFWVSAIKGFRAIYSGALSNHVWTTDRFTNQSRIDPVAIWDLLDGIGIWVRAYISTEPIYNIDEIVSGYFGSKLNGTSVVNELISASIKFNKPILATINAMSLPNALDGGWDPTPEQALQSPLPTNPELQKLVFESFFQLVENNLKDIVTSISIGNSDPWMYKDFSSYKPSDSVTLGDIAVWSNFKFFDLSVSPSPSLDLIKKYLQDPSNFRVSSTTIGSSGNDSINTYVGNNNVYLKGGFDTAIASGGNDNFFLSYLIKKSFKFEYTVYVTKPTDVLSILSLDFGNGKTYEFKFSPTKPYTAANSYWDTNSIEVNLPDDLKLDKLIFGLNLGGWAKIENLRINNLPIDRSIGTHTRVESWSEPDWVLNGDKYTFNLSSFIKKNYEGKKTLIDGGAGLDKIYFENATSANDFKITVFADKINLTDRAGNYPPVEATKVERLVFNDKSIAIDLNGNAGTTAKILGAVFGKDAVSNKNFVGIGLHFLDAGWTYDNLAGLALEAAGAKTNDQVVSLLWTNVIGTKPTAADKLSLIALLENGMSAGALAHLAADTSFNTMNINLVGLAQTGIDYIPVS
jgi:hypothetical protein